MTEDWFQGVKKWYLNMSQFTDVHPSSQEFAENTKQSAIQKRALEIALSLACRMIAPEGQEDLFNQLLSKGQEEALKQWEGDRNV